jgi:REP element-mobilizing transposase RayT
MNDAKDAKRQLLLFHDRARQRPHCRRHHGGRHGHWRRPEHAARFPVHVTLRAQGGLGSFRRPGTFSEILAVLGEARIGMWRGRRRAPPGGGASVRVHVLQFSVQTNHIHLLVESQDKEALARGVQGVAIRVARAVNRVAARRGKVWAHRYHAHELRTKREVRNAYAYVLENWRKHKVDGGHLPRRARDLDPCASGVLLGRLDRARHLFWLDGCRRARALPDVCRPVLWYARTWLAKTAWLEVLGVAPDG